MNPLKVGDRVRCITPNDQIEEGQKGVIVELTEDFLRIDTVKWTFLKWRFKKVSTFKGNVK